MHVIFLTTKSFKEVISPTTVTDVNGFLKEFKRYMYMYTQHQNLIQSTYILSYLLRYNKKMDVRSEANSSKTMAFTEHAHSFEFDINM